MLGEALKGERRESLEIFTKVYWPTGPGGAERHRAVAQAHPGVDRRLAAAPADRLRRPLPGPPLRHETPLEETMQAFADVVRAGQGALHRRLRVDRGPDPRRARARAGARRPAHLEPAAVLDALAGDRGRGRPGVARARAVARSSGRPMAQGVLTGKYLPGQPPPAGSRATDEKGGARFIERLPERRRAARACRS